jgi:hypothetical protein
MKIVKVDDDTYEYWQLVKRVKVSDLEKQRLETQRVLDRIQKIDTKNVQDEQIRDAINTKNTEIEREKEILLGETIQLERQIEEIQKVIDGSNRIQIPETKTLPSTR